MSPKVQHLLSRVRSVTAFKLKFHHKVLFGVEWQNSYRAGSLRQSSAKHALRFTHTHTQHPDL